MEETLYKGGNIDIDLKGKYHNSSSLASSRG